MSMFPYDVNEIADGPIRCMYADQDTTLPVDLGDIIGQVDPYDAITDWKEFGATAGPFQTSRAIATAGYNIQQTANVVLERITETTRTVVVAVAEFRPEIMQMLEEGAGIDVVGAATGVGAYRKVPFGNIFDLTPYRMAFIGRRSKSQGVVIEPGGTERGRLFAYIAYRTQLSADTLQYGFAEGELASANVTFKLMPEPDTPDGEEHGFWIFEDAGTLT